MLEEEEQKFTDQLAKEEQRIPDQLAEKELIEVDERQGEFVISVSGEVNMLLSIQPLACESEGH